MRNGSSAPGRPLSISLIGGWCLSLKHNDAQKAPCVSCQASLRKMTATGSASLKSPEFLTGLTGFTGFQHLQPEPPMSRSNRCPDVEYADLNDHSIGHELLPKGAGLNRS